MFEIPAWAPSVKYRTHLEVRGWNTRKVLNYIHLTYSSEALLTNAQHEHRAWRFVCLFCHLLLFNIKSVYLKSITRVTKKEDASAWLMYCCLRSFLSFCSFAKPFPAVCNWVIGDLVIAHCAVCFGKELNSLKASRWKSLIPVFGCPFAASWSDVVFNLLEFSVADNKSDRTETDSLSQVGLVESYLLTGDSLIPHVSNQRQEKHAISRREIGREYLYERNSDTMSKRLHLWRGQGSAWSGSQRAVLHWWIGHLHHTDIGDGSVSGSQHLVVMPCAQLALEDCKCDIITDCLSERELSH